MIRKPISDWEQLYKEERFETLPWFHPALDHDLDKVLNELGIRYAKALDLGTGPGTQAMALAERGFHVTAADVSETAVRLAALAAKEKGLAVNFLQDDILKTRLQGPFNFIFDRGCFHVFTPEKRKTYIEAVHRLIWTGGYLFLKCFSHLEPWGEGPQRFSPAQIRELFSAHFHVRSIHDSVFEGTPIEHRSKALFCVLQNKKS